MNANKIYTQQTLMDLRIIKSKIMKTAEEILIEFGCPDVPFDENVTMYYPAILSAMEEFANARVDEAMRWRDPKEELPEEGVVVFVKLISSCGAGDEILYTSSSVRNDFYHSADADPFGCEGYYPSGNGGRVRATVIGWRPIE